MPPHAGTARDRGRAAGGRIDWPAIALLVVPLLVMALFELWSRAPRTVSLRPAPAHVETVVVSAEGSTSWHGDLALEAMPVALDVRSRARVAAVEPRPMPWQGDLMLEAMPVARDVRSSAALAPAAPVTGRAAATLAPASMCLPAEPAVLSGAARGAPNVPPQSPAAFGRALAAAARAQTDAFVIYNPDYVTLTYPLGDTQSLYGVCTDVVVRAYRAFGIDFQELIHTSRVGRGDPSIDHRRVEVVRRFLERYGTSFEISEFPEDFLPGDIVTYHRPQGRVSQHHVAIVSDQIAPSGRPLIVHNRGWGPQLEDALFGDRMTGHYRLSPGEIDAFVLARQLRAAGRRQPNAVSVATGR